MKIKSKIAAIGMSMLLSVGAFAGSEGDSYAGIGYHAGIFKVDYLSSITPSAVKLEVGHYLADNFAVEGQMTVGVISDEYEGLDFSVKEALSLFVKGDMPVSEYTSVYGLLGFTVGQGQVESGGSSYITDDTGVSFGVGFDTTLINDMVFSVEYISYLRDDISLDGKSIGYDYSGINIGLSTVF